MNSHQPNHEQIGEIQVDLQLAQLWVSFLCHELISPVGAINNGIEFLEDQGSSANKADTLAMAIDLMRSSGQQAAVRLKFFRLALGRAGGDQDLGIKAAIELVKSYFESESRLKFQSVSPSPACLNELTGRRVQLWLNLVLVVAATLQRGGVIKADFSAAGDGFSFQALGTVARMDPQIASLLQGDSTVLVTPRNCLAKLCGLLAKGLGMVVTIAETSDSAAKEESLTLTLKL